MSDQLSLKRANARFILAKLWTWHIVTTLFLVTTVSVWCCCSQAVCIAEILRDPQPHFLGWKPISGKRGRGEFGFFVLCVNLLPCVVSNCVRLAFPAFQAGNQVEIGRDSKLNNGIILNLDILPIKKVFLGGNKRHGRYYLVALAMELPAKLSL